MTSKGYHSLPGCQVSRHSFLDLIMKTEPVYLDYNATTPLDPRVFDAMKPWFLEQPGNAGSRTHLFGLRAKDAVEAARAEVARHFAAAPEEIVFTSGATESNNIVILGIAAYGEATGKKHIISTAIEHKAVLEPLEQLSRRGFDVEIVPVSAGGFVEPETIKSSVRNDTLLISVMHANNETGVLQPVEEIAAIAGNAGVPLHIDAAQTFGKELESLQRLECDFASISAHKIYGPKGVGAILVRRRAGSKRILDAITFGGGQERSLRPGTLPVPLVVGLGRAAAIAAVEWRERRTHAASLKARLLGGLRQIDAVINGDQTRCQPHIVNVSFSGVDSEALMMATREQIAISNGSACTSTSYSPSHVLLAMGYDEDRIDSAVRISWGPGIDDLPVNALVDSVKSLRV